MRGKAGLGCLGGGLSCLSDWMFCLGIGWVVLLGDCSRDELGWIYCFGVTWEHYWVVSWGGGGIDCIWVGGFVETLFCWGWIDC